MKKVLIFTDSRGQHKPAGSSHKIFAERLASEASNVEVEMVLCPMKWTTTLDFFDYINEKSVEDYDAIVLYTGIVEWSPRPQESAINDLYNNLKIDNEGDWQSNTRDYSKKIVNNKKTLFDNFFGEENIVNYLERPFETTYEGKKTINMYSLEMARVVAEKLKAIKNLIFINSNRLLPDWEGDFKRGRPENIDVTHRYSDLFTNILGPERTIDLRKWDKEQIKKLTCDNMHLTEQGSDWIFFELIKRLGLEMKSDWNVTSEFFAENLIRDKSKLVEFKPIERFFGAKKDKFSKNYAPEGKPFATLIIGLMLESSDSQRLHNLSVLLEWIQHHYEDMFDVLVVEQGDKRKLKETFLSRYKFVRYEFIYNPQEYNRGWGYNVAVQHFCEESKVVALMDTDVLPGSNFIADIRDCYIDKYDIISPYQNVYYTDEIEADKIVKTKSLTHLNDPEKIKNPVTITGGIVIVNRKTYLELKGFEQYVGYGCEDRSLDVLALGLVKKERIKISPHAYVHLYHPTDKAARKNFKEIYAHLKENYSCEWSPKLGPTEFIHSFCNHPSKKDLVKLLIKKSKSFADIALYEEGKSISINGQEVLDDKDIDGMLLPPNFKDFDSYQANEIYEAPDPDTDELEQYRNAFLGERCFIIGNGPSLNEHDLSLLKNEYTFGVNSFFYKTRETGFRPTFYVVEDSSVIKENLKEIKSFYAPFKFFPTVYKRLHPKQPNTFFFKMNRGFYEKSSPNFCVPRFSTDATKELFCGQSVTYINLQLAYYMGFKEVYLIGMDFSYIIPDSHKRSGDVLLSDSDDPNHFHKDYFGAGKTWKDPKLDRVGNNYRMAKVAFESVGRKVYNATVGGSLEIFERKDYNSLFNKNVDSSESIFNQPSTFAEANKLFLEGRYTDSLVRYVSLVKDKPSFLPYKEAAVRAYLKAKDKEQPVQRELVDFIKGFL